MSDLQLGKNIRIGCNLLANIIWMVLPFVSLEIVMPTANPQHWIASVILLAYCLIHALRYFIKIITMDLEDGKGGTRL